MKQITSIEEFEEAIKTHNIELSEDIENVLRAILTNGWKPSYKTQLPSEMLTTCSKCRKQ